MSFVTGALSWIFWGWGGFKSLGSKRMLFHKWYGVAQKSSWRWMIPVLLLHGTSSSNWDRLALLLKNRPVLPLAIFFSSLCWQKTCVVNPVRGLMWVKTKLSLFLARLVLIGVGSPHCCTNVCANKSMEMSGSGTARLLLSAAVPAFPCFYSRP